MLPDHRALGVFDRARCLAQILAQERLEWPFADEADTGAVGLVEDRKAGRAGAPAHLLLVEVADGKQGFTQGGRRHLVQKVTLILGRVRTLPEPPAPAAVAVQSRIMSGCDPRGPQAVHVVQTDAELDLPVAQDVGVRSAPGLV